MLNISKNVFFTASIQIGGTPEKPKYKDFYLSSELTSNSGRWIVGTYKDGILKPAFKLRLHPDLGLKIYPIGTEAKRIDFDLNRLINLLLSNNPVPSPGFLDNTGSIVLEVAREAIAYRYLDTESISIDGATEIEPILPQDWFNAYLTVENIYSLPLYLREQFSDLMLSHEVDITFTEVAEVAEVAEVPEVAEVAEVAEVPEVAEVLPKSKNGHKRKLTDLKDLVAAN